MEKDLEIYLKKLDLTGYLRGNRAAGTKLLSESIEKFSAENSLVCKSEVILGPQKPSGWHGVVDFVLESEQKKYVIEIDSSNTRFSVVKLLHVESLGYTPIWVRWCYKNTFEIPKNIYLIDLTLIEVKRRQRERAVQPGDLP